MEDLKILILLSLQREACTLYELNKRDFLKNYSNDGVGRIVNTLIQQNVIKEDYDTDVLSVSKRSMNKYFKEIRYTHSE